MSLFGQLWLIEQRMHETGAFPEGLVRKPKIAKMSNDRVQATAILRHYIE
jgi:hypothetical protein